MHFSPTFDKLTTKMYAFLLKRDFAWNKYIKNILDECGLSYLWTTDEIVNINWIKCNVKRILMDQNAQNWKNMMDSSAKGLNYRIFKENIELEEYLKILPKKSASILVKFRANNFKLPIETGRWQNIPREQRKCHICQTNQIGDEYHYIFECSNSEVVKARKNFILTEYTKRPSTIKFKQLFSSTNPKTLKNLCKFLLVVKKNID